MDHDVFTLKAILTSSTNVAPRVQRLKRFEDEAPAFNDHPQFSDEDKRKARQTEQEEELSERDKILADMIDAAEVLQAEKDATKGEAAEAKRMLDAERLAVRELAMGRRHRQPKEKTTNDEEENEDQSTTAPWRGKKRSTREIDDLDNDLLGLLERSERRQEMRADKQMEQIDKRFEEQAREASDRQREERQDRKDERLLSVLGEIARKLPGNRGPSE
ncbi:hypothetical protein I4F81_012078 [Pyropia yezoensis]|uniref:Uncharacterized protein n=1 Tax=Pyropia yezoensis TaxID=2788 RepID=A0ACC3CHM7_PYRYE|nr:hypothetical protein I4F81_012078 [Neopyropia yezoensis]